MSQRILVVDGDSASQGFIRLLLEGHGCQVDLASGGIQGLERAGAGQYAAVLIDFHLPDMDGHALGLWLAERRGDGFSPALIGLSANRAAVAPRAGDGGVFSAILPKPIQPGALFEAIDRVLASTPAPPAATRRGGPEGPDAARQAAVARWRDCDLQSCPRVFACPAPTPEQAKALALCFEMVDEADAELIVLLERHGMSEARRLSQRDGKTHRPIISLSADHGDICDALFEVGKGASWRQVAALVSRKQAQPGGEPQERRHASRLTLEREQLAAVAPALSMRHRRLPAAPPPKGVDAGVRILLIEESAKGQLPLTITLAQGGHDVCRVLDMEAARIIAARNAFDLAVIDAPREVDPCADLGDFRAAHPELPILLLHGGLSVLQRADLARLDLVTILARKAPADAVLKAIADAVPKSVADPIDRYVLRTLVSSVGNESVVRLVSKLIAQVEALMRGGPLLNDRWGAGRLVQLSSCARMLGLPDLSSACASLAAVLEQGGDTAPGLGALADAMMRVREAMARQSCSV